jgi:hypothetical protein
VPVHTVLKGRAAFDLLELVEIRAFLCGRVLWKSRIPLLFRAYPGSTSCLQSNDNLQSRIVHIHGQIFSQTQPLQRAT